MRHSHGKVALLVLLAAAAAGALAPAARAQATLRYKFKEGEKIPYAMEQKMKMTMDVGGNVIEMNMTQAVDITWHIKSVDAGGKAQMTQRFDRLRYTMDGPMGKLEYDSKAGTEPDDALGKAIVPFLKAMVGAEFSLSMDPRGRMTDVKVPEKILEALKELPGAAALGGLFSEDSMKQMVNQGAMVLPEEAVSKGKTWDQKVETKTPVGKMIMDTRFTYEGPATRGGRALEQIALKPKVTIEPDPAAQAEVKLKGQETKGASLFDNAAGRLLETSATTNMEMEVSAGGMTITQKVEQTVTLKLQDKAK